jgi:hypothetical protein
MSEQVRWLAGEFEALWEVAGLAELFAFQMAQGGGPGDPAATVLAAHRELVVAALRQESVGDPQEVTDALLGVYLSRRLAGRRTDGWALAAADTIGLPQ